MTNIILDPEDEWILKQTTYTITKDGYVKMGKDIKGERFLHRIVMHPVPIDKEIDHKNVNPLDNRKQNLRFATKSQNIHRQGRPGKSGYFGVSFHKNRWQASIRINGSKIFIGNYGSAILAAYAYDYEAKRHYKEFARLNFPSGWKIEN